MENHSSAARAGQSISGIARDLDLDCKTVRSCLRQLTWIPYEGGQAAPFVFIAAETSQPHSIGTFEAGTTFLENSAAKLQACLAAFKACSETGYWPDLSCNTTLDITPWQQFSPAPGMAVGIGIGSR